MVWFAVQCGGWRNQFNSVKEIQDWVDHNRHQFKGLMLHVWQQGGDRNGKLVLEGMVTSHG